MSLTRRVCERVPALCRDYNGPCFLFDTQGVGDAARSLLELGREFGVRFIAAAKALPTASLLEAASQNIGGVDVSNEGEIQRLLNLISCGRSELGYVALTGPAMQIGQPPGADKFADLLTLNVENLSQLVHVDGLQNRCNHLELGARIGFNFGDVSTRFGFPESGSEDLRRVFDHPLFGALHCHLGADAVAKGRSLESAAALMRIADSSGVNVRRINLGGGFRNESIAELRATCAAVRKVIPSTVEVIFEPGAWLTECNGFALSRVVSIDHRPRLGMSTLVVDLSRACHVRWSRPFVAKFFGRKPLGSRAVFLGPTCYERDCLTEVEWGAGPDVVPSERGQWVLFGGISGYDLAFNVAFNGIPRAEVIEV